jgi:very-short-patch-repair endonuclease
LEDLRRIAPASEFAAALRQAEYLRLPLEDRLEPDHTRSQLETAFLRLCRRHRLPSPEVNVQVGTYLVDFLWRTQRLIVETDGYRAHGTRSAFERDRARDTDLLLSSYVIVRLTQRQITQRPAAVAASIRSLLSRGAA